jgi:hypothetical protein
MLSEVRGALHMAGMLGPLLMQRLKEPQKEAVIY